MQKARQAGRRMEKNVERILIKTFSGGDVKCVE